MPIQTTFHFIEIEAITTGIVKVQIVRPEALNALNIQVLQELKAAFEELALIEQVRVVILTGTDRAFIAGADIKAMSEMTPAEALEFGKLGHATTHAIASFPAPVIAAVNGFALGGGLEVALSCDLIYLSDKGRLGLPEVGLGLIPGFGGTQRLGRLIGYHRARELTYTGRHVRAEEALAIGLALDVFPHAELLDNVTRIARDIASKGPTAVRTAKSVLESGRDTTLAAGLAGELSSFKNLFSNSEAAEGMGAFIEKRPPAFAQLDPAPSGE